MAATQPIPVRELHGLFERHLRFDFAERHHSRYALIYRDATAPGADPVEQLRSGALFFETMEAAVDEAYRRSLQPGCFLVAECIFSSEQQPAIVHSRVA
ncbi:MAG: hypothetical protein F4Y71_09065 [Acidobacteria bacterium]|nr:hypothetical protein [Acidobacteriota bacterium]MYG75242.1 hypothetical protein [Acidobacteriota bacterium]